MIFKLQISILQQQKKCLFWIFLVAATVFFFCKMPFNRSCVHILPLFIFNFTSKHCIIWKFNKQKLIFPLTQWNWFVTPEIFKLNLDLTGNLEFIELGRDLFVTWEMSIYYKIIKITIFCIPSAVKSYNLFANKLTCNFHSM